MNRHVSVISAIYRPVGDDATCQAITATEMIFNEYDLR